MNAVQPQTKESRLAKINRGIRRDPLRCLFFGQEGTGKTTLAANAPKPIFLDIEDGSGRVDVARYTFRDDPRGHVPNDFGEVIAALDDLTVNQHEFETVVIDTADRLEALIWQHVCRRESKPGREPLTNIEAFGYGRGYAIALDEWRLLAVKLDRLRARGMNVILLSHANVKTFKNPAGPDYDRYQLALHDKAAGLLKSWCDIVGFLHFEEGVSKSGNERAKGWSTGKRTLCLGRTAAYDAKGRGGMPDEILIEPEDPWAPLAKAIEAAASMTTKQLIALIDAEIARIGGGEVVAKKVAMAVSKANGNAEALHRIVNELKRKEPIQPKEEV